MDQPCPPRDGHLSRLKSARTARFATTLGVGAVLLAACSAPDRGLPARVSIVQPGLLAPAAEAVDPALIVPVEGALDPFEVPPAASGLLERESASDELTKLDASEPAVTDDWAIEAVSETPPPYMLAPIPAPTRVALTSEEPSEPAAPAPVPAPSAPQPPSPLGRAVAAVASLVPRLGLPIPQIPGVTAPAPTPAAPTARTVMRTNGPVSMTTEQMVANATRLLGVPYVWGGNSEAGLDCSAYVSKVWGVGRHTTDTISNVSFSISKDELLTGDALNLPTWKDPHGYGHIRLFDRWANEQKTAVWVYEETSATGNSVHRRIAYDDRYQPIRRVNYSPDGRAPLVAPEPAPVDDAARRRVDAGAAQLLISDGALRAPESGAGEDRRREATQRRREPGEVQARTADTPSTEEREESGRTTDRPAREERRTRERPSAPTAQPEATRPPAQRPEGDEPEQSVRPRRTPVERDENDGERGGSGRQRRGEPAAPATPVPTRIGDRPVEVERPRATPSPTAAGGQDEPDDERENRPSRRGREDDGRADTPAQPTAEPTRAGVRPPQRAPEPTAAPARQNVPEPEPVTAAARPTRQSTQPTAVPERPRAAQPTAVPTQPRQAPQPTSAPARQESGANSGSDRKASPSTDSAPKAEAPKAEAPKQNAPKAEAPKKEAPKAEAPKQSAPKAEAPKEQSKAEAPKAQPKTEAPAAPKGGSGSDRKADGGGSRPSKGR